MKNTKRLFLIFSIYITSFACFSLVTVNSTRIQGEETPQKIFSASSYDFDYSNKFNFSAEEHILNQYPWQKYNSELIFPIPEEFDHFDGTVIFECQNKSIIPPVFYEGDENALTNNYKYSQAWQTDYASSILDFSLYMEKDKADSEFLFNIREGSKTGTVVFSESTIFTSKGWNTFTPSVPIFLNPGKYYLEYHSTMGESYLKSCGGGNNESETWYNDGANWISCGYDISMRINLTQFLSPEDIDLHLGSHKIVNYLSNYGKVDLAFNLDDIPNDLIITDNSSSNILINYMMDVNYSRIEPIEYEITQRVNDFQWNLSFSELPAGFSIQSYRKLIYGMQSDYTNIELWDGNSSVAYEISSSNLLVSDFPSQNLNFLSPNYIAQASVPSSIILGEVVKIVVDCYAVGDISLFLNNLNFLQPLQSFQDVQSCEYDWYIDPYEVNDVLSIDIVYYGENELGILSLPLSLLLKGNLIAQNYFTPAFETLEIVCLYQDYYSKIPIENAEVVLTINEVQAQMVDIGDGWYSFNLDLNKYGFLPGNHSLKIEATKDGFSSIEYLRNLQILKNDVNIDIVLTNSKLKPGDTLLYSILMQENLTQNTLRRPISIKVQMHALNEMGALQTVYDENFDGLISSLNLNWTSPTDLQENHYSITVEVISDYYQGAKTFSNAFQTIEPLPWYLYLFVVAGAVSVGGFSFFFYCEKVKKSVLGVITLHDNGMPLAHQFSEMIVQEDIILVSAAFTGILSIIKEITGSHTRVIEIDGGYLNITKENGFWLILLSRMHPRFIESTILKFINSFKEKYITEEILAATMPIQVDFNQLLEQYFHTKFLNPQIKAEQVSEENVSLPENFGPNDGLSPSIPSDADLE
ncbi:hypothetical protein NEF87_001588 [Candidatus Lokiarchaeum ossiferum]|uniref:Carboxypeptidase regulatory-like domain-containing protein n=1 Tax=Candidatus Lokiarchaeum ossiferum TaxID=2951803 RepID=A0ABY6HPQ0_9ARCH|nr:hypothetical protein NEF87_001588 [Candidatus Lokiarchaeum sp. B-35]